MVVKIIPADGRGVSGKLADAEIHFTDGPFEGLKLLGFGVWERRGGGRNVTFPSRAYSVNGERRNFALLRPVFLDHGPAASDRARDLILNAYAEFERLSVAPVEVPAAMAIAAGAGAVTVPAAAAPALGSLLSMAQALDARG